MVVDIPINCCVRCVELKCQLDATEVFIPDLVLWFSSCWSGVEQAIRSAIKTSVASSWHFISTY